MLLKRNAWGETLLHRACKKNDLHTVRVLIQAGINVNMQDNAGWTALHEAAAVGSQAVVEELLKAGANPSTRSYGGVTPLQDAIASGNQEVVKLLQFGSSTCDRTHGGISNLDMAKERDMKKPLVTFREPLVSSEKPHDGSAKHKNQGCKSSEAQSQKWLCSQRHFSSNIQSKKSGDKAGARELSDIQQREKQANTQNLSQPGSLMMVLEEIWRKQTEISTRLLTAPQDADRFSAALTEIQNQLSELLNKQVMERDQLARKRRRVSDSLWQRVSKTQLVSLASRQKKLVEILQKQMHLVELLVKKRAQLSSGQMNPQHSAEDRDKKDQSIKPVPKSAASRAQDRATNRVTPVTRPEASRPPAQRQCEESSTSLSKLMLKGLVEPGCALHLFIKSRLRCAFVLADGSLKDLKGRVHPSPERWLDSVLGNKVPVSPTYAWNKVMLRGEPLSSYNLDQEIQTTLHHDHCYSSVWEDLNSEEKGLKRLVKVQMIHLVEDEEFLPNAVMDPLWEKLKSDNSSDLQWTDI